MLQIYENLYWKHPPQKLILLNQCIVIIARA